MLTSRTRDCSSHSYVYVKSLGDVLDTNANWGHHDRDQFRGVRGIALYTVRPLSMGILDGSRLAGKIVGGRYRSFEGAFGTSFPAYILKELRRLDRIIYEAEERKTFKPPVWFCGGMLLGIVAFDENQAVTAAHERKLRVPSEWPSGFQDSRPWSALREHQDLLRLHSLTPAF